MNTTNAVYIKWQIRHVGISGMKRSFMSGYGRCTGAVSVEQPTITAKELTDYHQAWKAGDLGGTRTPEFRTQEVINVICHYRNIVGGKRIMKLIGLDLERTGLHSKHDR